ncbi:hypothetical protein Taro_004534 [Colocasia esculenta]|uniref:HTH myb-type domain-containing protein n=1 Tax=Colocasia esculenta TaxID=4460 RepID=A0A843TRX8_COLES|nr:hypothetical protein [Colocasia esculenta]
MLDVFGLRLFLLGLDKYGKGDWRSISRNFVISRTPTQVASHAQKYFIRLNSMNKDRRRSSIHDITTVSNGDLSASQQPITGQTNGPIVGAGKPIKPPAQQPPGANGVGVYGTTTIGQPVGGPLVSAVGTPVNLPGAPPMAYAVRPPVPGTIVPEYVHKVFETMVHRTDVTLIFLGMVWYTMYRRELHFGLAPQPPPLPPPSDQPLPL